MEDITTLEEAIALLDQWIAFGNEMKFQNTRLRWKLAKAREHLRHARGAIEHDLAIESARESADEVPF